MKLPFEDWRQPLFFIAENVYIHSFVLLCIVGNTIVLSLQWYGQSQKTLQVLDQVNLIFTVIFTIEFLIKIGGYGKRFFQDPWNIFDMLIVLTTIVGLIMSQTSNSQFGPQTSVIRSFRIIRIFFLFKSNKALKSTMMTFLVSIPAMANIGGLLILINIIFSILGMYLFAEVKLNGEINEQSHFMTFGTSFLTLIRIITGEKWPKMMEALSKSNSPSYQCIENPSFDDYSDNQGSPIGCGSELIAKLFFFSYSLVMVTVFIKLFIAIILQTFQQTTERDNKFMSSDLVQRFRDVWSMFDQNASSFIKTQNYPSFLVALDEPLGWNVSFKHNYLKQIAYLAEVSLPKYNTATEYYFLDVLEHLLLLMIIKREVIGFAIKNRHFELFGVQDEESYFNFNELIYQIQNFPHLFNLQPIDFSNQALIQLPLIASQETQATINPDKEKEINKNKSLNNAKKSFPSSTELETVRYSISTPILEFKEPNNQNIIKQTKSFNDETYTPIQAPQIFINNFEDTVSQQPQYSNVKFSQRKSKNNKLKQQQKFDGISELVNKHRISQIVIDMSNLEIIVNKIPQVIQLEESYNIATNNKLHQKEIQKSSPMSEFERNMKLVEEEMLVMERKKDLFPFQDPPSSHYQIKDQQLSAQPNSTVFKRVINEDDLEYGFKPPPSVVPSYKLSSNNSSLQKSQLSRRKELLSDLKVDESKKQLDDISDTINSFIKLSSFKGSNFSFNRKSHHKD